MSDARDVSVKSRTDLVAAGGTDPTREIEPRSVVEPPRPGRRRRSALAAVTAAIFSGIVITALMLGPQLRSPEQLAADAAPPPASPVTVLAERRQLTEAVVLRGLARPGASVKLLPPPGATGDSSVVTDVEVRAGQVLREGQVVIVRSGEPMFALRLRFPLYRDITGGVRGPDVIELQRALIRLGYRLTLTGSHDAATQRALSRFFIERGFTPPSGTPEAAEQVRGARAAVADAERALDEARRTGTGVAAAQEQLDRAAEKLADARIAAGPKLSRTSVLLLDRNNRKISKLDVRVGSVLNDPAKPILELDGEAGYVVAIAGRDQAGLLRPGNTGTAFDDTAGTRTEIQVTSVGTEPATGPNGERGFEVRLKFVGEMLEVGTDRSIRVDIPAGSTSEEVLAVPLNAIFSRPDATTFVTVVGAGGKTTEVEVTTGRIAGGWVEITPTSADQVEDGTPVVVGDDAAPIEGK